MKKNTVCALCLQESEIRESHIVPKFVGKWMKENGTGYLVSAENGSKRIQDITKLHLLCDDCEGKFSKWEKYFADNIFFPFHKNKVRTFDYNENLQSFILSLSWRALKKIAQGFKEKNPDFPLNSFVDEAENNWRKFLNGDIQSINQYENHFVFLDYSNDDKKAEMHPKFHWYTLHSIDFTIVTNDKKVYMYVKLPWMIFVTSIYPTSLEGWNGTIIKENGKITCEQSIKDESFNQFLLDRSLLAFNNSSGPTPEVAQRRLEAVIKKDPKKFLESNILRSKILEKDLQRKKRMENMPKSVIALVEQVIRPIVDNPQLTNAENQLSRWKTRHIADKIADLSKEEANKLDIMNIATMKMVRILQKDKEFTFKTNSLWITFMATHNTTKKIQQKKIINEIERLRSQTNDKIPIAVISFDFLEGGSESGFLIPRNIWD